MDNSQREAINQEAKAGIWYKEATKSDLLRKWNKMMADYVEFGRIARNEYSTEVTVLFSAGMIGATCFAQSPIVSSGTTGWLILQNLTYYFELFVKAAVHRIVQGKYLDERFRTYVRDLREDTNRGCYFVCAIILLTSPNSYFAAYDG